MWIRLLGPTEVGADGALSPRDRVVLSALCLAPGQAVPAEVLADALWGEAPPKSWGKIVQGSIMRLRRAMGSSAIVTSSAGYRIVVPAHALDTVEFEALVARGRSFLALREPERATTALTEALALWRGAPFQDLGDWERARSEGARLLEVRLAAEEDLVEAHLAAGRAVDGAAMARPLVAREPFRERRWTLLATALYRMGRQGEALDVLRRASRTIRDELGLDPGPGLIELEARILAQDPLLLEVPNRIGGASPTCPYRGLRPFEAADADFYFGRAAVVAESVRRLGQYPLLLVVGASGSGKSSLARAGILPAMARLGHPASVLNPGIDPMAELTTAIASLRPDGLLVVDQLEEVFAVTSAPQVSRDFLDRIAALVEGGTVVLATLRADFLGSLAQSPALSRLAERGLLLLTPLAEDELRAAIEEPARLVGLKLEPGLVDLLVRDVADAPGGLPLLSHALAETWDRRDGAVLTVEGYRSTGGIRAAVAQSADGLYESLATQDREVLRSVLLRLVTPTATGEPMVARVPTRVFAGSPEAPRLLDLLVRARLVTTSHDEATIAHESLVRAWPRLRGWLDEDVEGQRVLSHLQAAADAWDTLGRPDDELYRGARLAAVDEWRQRAHPVLTPVEEAFLAAAAAQADIERTRAERAHAHQLRRNRQLAGALVAVVALLAVALASGTVASLRGREAQAAAARADHAAVEAVAARLGTTAVSQPNTALSLLLARQAVDVADDPVTQGALLEALVKVPGLVGLAHPVAPPLPRQRDNVVTPDGRRLLVQDSHGEIHLLDIASGTSLAGPLGGSKADDWDSAKYATGLIDGGRTALVAAPDAQPDADGPRTISLVPVRVEDGLPAGPPSSVPGSIDDGYFHQDRLRVSPDGRTLVSVLDRRVRIWHRTGRRWQGPTSFPLPSLPDSVPDQDLVAHTTFSADGSRAAVQMNLQGPPFYVFARAAFVVDTARASLVGPLLTSRRDGSGFWHVALSPDGHRLLVGDRDEGAVQVRDVDSGEDELTIPGKGATSALAWSDDGRLVAIGRSGGGVDVFSVRPLRAVQTIPGSDEVVTVALTDTGGLVSQDITGTISRYALSPTSPVTAAVPTDRIHGVSAAGSTVAVGGDDGRVSLYDLHTLQEAGPALTLGPYRQPDPTADPAAHRRVSALAVVPDGSALIAADRVGHLRMWSLPGRELLWSRDDTPTSWLDVSPDGRYLATVGFTPGDAMPDGIPTSIALTVWDLQTRAAILTDDFTDAQAPNPPPKPRSVVFSPDSRHVAAAFFGDLVRVYDLGNVASPRSLSGGVLSLAFTPDSGRLVGASLDQQKILVWDTATGAELGSTSAPGLMEMSHMAYTHDGRWLVLSHMRSLTILDGTSLRVAVADLPLPSDGTNDAFALAPTDENHMIVGAQHTLIDLETDPAQWASKACQVSARTLTPEEWDRYLPSLPYNPACA